MVVMVDYVREITEEKLCKYGKYGSFEHLLFSFSSSPPPPHTHSKWLFLSVFYHGLAACMLLQVFVVFFLLYKGTMFYIFIYTLIKCTYCVNVQKRILPATGV